MSGRVDGAVRTAIRSQEWARPGHGIERGPGAGRAEPRAEGRFRDALRALGREIDRGEGVLRRALAAGHSGLSAGDLIALQAGIYRYGEAVDLVAKLVDRAGSAVRTTLQGGGS